MEVHVIFIASVNDPPFSDIFHGRDLEIVIENRRISLEREREREAPILVIRFGGSVVLSISQAIGSGININRCMESAYSCLISPRKQNFQGCAETGNKLAFPVKLKHQTSSSVSKTAHASDDDGGGGMAWHV